MSDYVNAFRDASTQLTNYVKAQLTQVVGWQNLPGQLNKISASSAGFVWGFNTNGDFYWCKEPCDGSNWTNVPQPSAKAGMPLDINTDETNVYVLYGAEAVTPVNNSPIKTGQIPIGDVGMPPGHIAPVPYGAIVSTAFLGPAVDKVAGDVMTGTGYTAILTDNRGITASFPLTTIGNGGFFHTFVGNPQDTQKLMSTFQGSTSLSIEVTAPSKTTEPPGPKVFMRSVRGDGDWTSVTVPGNLPPFPSINLTDSFMFVGKKGCAKPCTTNSWVDIPMPPVGGSPVGVVAASSGNTYSVVQKPDGFHTFKGAPNGQGGWNELPSMKGKFPVAVGADNQIAYVTKLGSSVLERCDAPYDKSDSCQIADTTGMSILEGRSVSINPASHQTYITASSSGPAGNIFQRLDDMGDLHVDKILEGVKDYNNNMDNQVNALGDSLKLQNEQVASGMTRKQAINAVRDAIKYDGDIAPAQEEAQKLRREIEMSKNTQDVYQGKMLSLEIIVATLSAVALLYVVVGSILPSTITSGIAIAILAVGLGASVYFAMIG